MELNIMLRHLWRHRVLAALSVLAAVVAAVFSSYDVSTSGLEEKTSQTQFGAAQLQFYVDTRRPSLVSAQTQAADLIARSRVVASFVGSGAIKSRMAQELGIPARALSVDGPTPDTPGQQSVQPVAQQRANQIITEASPYSVYVDTDLTSPTITLFVQADTGKNAERLAKAVPEALSAYLGRLARGATSAERERIRRSIYDGTSTEDRRAARVRRNKLFDQFIAGGTVIRSLGEPIGSSVSAQSGKAISLLVFIVVLLALWAAIIVVSGLASGRRARADG